MAVKAPVPVSTVNPQRLLEGTTLGTYKKRPVGSTETENPGAAPIEKGDPGTGVKPPVVVFSVYADTSLEFASATYTNRPVGSTATE